MQILQNFQLRGVGPVSGLLYPSNSSNSSSSRNTNSSTDSNKPVCRLCSCKLILPVDLQINLLTLTFKTCFLRNIVAVVIFSSKDPILLFRI
jgi:hypothetical protein